MPEIFDIHDVDKFCSKTYEKWNSNTYWNYMTGFDLPKKQKVKKFSRGMRMKLSLAIALSHDAELLILDEATSGLDPVVREEILDILQEFLQDETHSVLISSHILSDLRRRRIISPLSIKASCSLWKIRMNLGNAMPFAP